MRALLAGMFCFGGLLACVGVASHFFPTGFGPPWLMGMLYALLLGVLAALSMFIFNRKGERPMSPGKSHIQRLAELDAQGLLVSESFQARRVFEVEEFEDEGLHYFIELADGAVLYLNGQYLYDYADGNEGSSVGFPCSQFTLQKHKIDQYVANIVCSGYDLKPEWTAAPFTPQEYDSGWVPEDGQILRDRSYEQIKAECLMHRRVAETKRGK